MLIGFDVTKLILFFSLFYSNEKQSPEVFGKNGVLGPLF